MISSLRNCKLASQDCCLATAGVFACRAGSRLKTRAWSCPLDLEATDQSVLASVPLETLETLCVEVVVENVPA